MKHFFGYGYVLIAIFIFICSAEELAIAQIFDKDIDFMSNNIVPIAKKMNHQNLINFIYNVLPELNNMIKENRYNLKSGLNKISDKQIIQKDIMIFAYSRARAKLGIPFGQWVDELKDYIFFELELICPIKEFLNLKPEAYQSQMSESNVKLVDGSYLSLLTWFSLTPYFQTLTLQTVQKAGKFPEVDQLIILPLLNYVNQQEDIK